MKLPAHSPHEDTLRLPLLEDPDVLKRPCTGFVNIKYVWTPLSEMNDRKETEEEAGVGAIKPLYGKLVVKLISAEKLINLDLQTAHSASNPFCTVTCYPESPGDSVKPWIWRCPTAHSCLSPVWDASFNFDFAWAQYDAKLKKLPPPCEASPQPPSDTEGCEEVGEGMYRSKSSKSSGSHARHSQRR